MDIKIIETFGVLIVFVLVYILNKRAINNTLKRFEIGYPRRKMVTKMINALMISVALIVLAAIWGVNHSQIIVFLTSLITALGIAFFAQWSLLSNITSGLILFFNHPLKIGDNLRIYDKEYPKTGRITDITYFFVHLKTTEGEHITIPNSVVLQKMIAVVNEEENSI
jgi:small-conductance mechanosensitive channel